MDGGDGEGEGAADCVSMEGDDAALVVVVVVVVVAVLSVAVVVVLILQGSKYFFFLARDVCGDRLRSNNHSRDFDSSI